MSPGEHDALLLVFGGLGSQALSLTVQAVRDALRGRSTAAVEAASLGETVERNVKLLDTIYVEVDRIDTRLSAVERASAQAEAALPLLHDLRERLAGVTSVVDLIGVQYFGDRWAEHRQAEKERRRRNERPDEL